MKKLILFLLTPVILMIGGCSAPIKVTGSWMNKEVVGTGKFSKVFLFAITSNMSARQSVENAQAKAAADHGITTVKSIDILTPNFLAGNPDKDVVMAKINETGCDAIFTSALVDVQSETRYVPGTTTYYPSMGYYGGYGTYGSYGTFGGYYGGYSSFAYEPGYYEEDHTYFIESNLYDAETGEIVWSVQSEAYNPGDLDKLASQYSYVLFEKLKSEGVLPKK